MSIACRKIFYNNVEEIKCQGKINANLFNYVIYTVNLMKVRGPPVIFRNIEVAGWETNAEN